MACPRVRPSLLVDRTCMSSTTIRLFERKHNRYFAEPASPYSVGAGGTLQSQTGGPVPDDPAQSNPIFAVLENKGKWLYVANQGINPNSGTSANGITATPSTPPLTS